MNTRTGVLLLSVPIALVRGDLDLSVASLEGVTGAGPVHFVTNAAQFRTLSGADYLAGCDFQLTGVVTLVDTNCDLVVLQNGTGAMARAIASQSSCYRSPSLLLWVSEVPPTRPRANASKSCA